MMKVSNFFLRRNIFTDKSTIGDLFMDNEFVCKTLEDTVRKQKIPGKTAILAGTYEVIITPSVRFKRPMPLLLDVPNFTGVRIHWGNTPEATEGCILLGEHNAPDFISNSRQTFELVYPKIEAKLKEGRLFLDIIGGRSKWE